MFPALATHDSSLRPQTFVYVAIGASAILLGSVWFATATTGLPQAASGTPRAPAPTAPVPVVGPPSRDEPELENEPAAETEKAGVGTPHPCCLDPQYQGCIYLDYNATSPIWPEVSQKIVPFITRCHGNPSSTHVYATPCSQAIDEARLHVGKLINAPNNPRSSVYFTSCGSEADNRAIDIALHNFKSIPGNATVIPKVVTCKTEHPAVICYLRVLHLNQQIVLHAISPDSEGFIDMVEFSASLTNETALVTIMHSNNEVGTIQPIQEISRLIQAFNREHDAGILLHSDAAQSLGKVSVDVQSLSIDMLTIVGHKFGAPKGIGALYVKDGIKMCPMLIGGGQERGFRAGTENVAFIAALGEAARLAYVEADIILVHMLTLKRALLAKLISKFGGFPGLMKFNGPARGNSPTEIGDLLKIIKAIMQSPSKSNRGSSGNDEYSRLSGGAFVDQLPNTVSVAFRGIKAYELIELLRDKVACSAGSACHAHDAGSKMSDVLLFMGVAPEYGFGTLRLSFGRHTTLDEIERAVEHIYLAVNTMRNGQQ